MALIIAMLNDGTIMTISKDKAKPSPLPDSWKLKGIFATGVILGTYLALMTVVFFWIGQSSDELSRGWSYVERLGIYIMIDRLRPATTGELFRTFRSRFLQIATIIAVYASWGFARIHGIGQGWAGVIWHYSIIFYIPLDFLKFTFRYALSGKFHLETFFPYADQRIVHGLHPPEESELFHVSEAFDFHC
ncbi:hypothetical protein OIU84_005570 [Salix udensis]|uniref:Uncharacterized protein n=1 Tax=Salix udensis TaxID=889485 RepID=A0AAD6P1E4_9ROSI|nr:hypothetical protein OIU84_005570 [Salix udensis]